MSQKEKPNTPEIIALQVIHTWATFNGGFMLTPERVLKLIEPILNIQKRES